MKSIRGFLITAVIVLVIVAVAYRIQFLRNLIFGS